MDMLIDKAPHTDTPTPWHQDQAYWMPGMPDRRSVSCWLALDATTVDNGCMWFVPGSHRRPVRTHRYSGESGHALETDAAESEALACPLAPGSATFHDGGTLHHSRGNSTDTRRRALIANFRPAAMIAWERERGYDHRHELDALGVESEHVIPRQALVTPACAPPSRYRCSTRPRLSGAISPRRC